MSRLAFAFGAGLLSPVNPCGFAMPPAFVGYYMGNADGGELARRRRWREVWGWGRR